MMRVYKYWIPIEDQFTLALPLGAQVLDVQMQGDAAQLWALVDPALMGPTAPCEAREFILRGTGHDIDLPGPSALSHCGTFQMQGGALVFHVFEVLQAKKQQ